MVLKGVGGGFGAVGDSKLGEDGLHVRLGSVFRDAKLLCDVVIGQSTCERMKNVHLTAGQRRHIRIDRKLVFNVR